MKGNNNCHHETTVHSIERKHETNMQQVTFCVRIGTMHVECNNEEHFIERTQSLIIIAQLELKLLQFYDYCIKLA